MLFNAFFSRGWMI